MHREAHAPRVQFFGALAENIERLHGIGALRSAGICGVRMDASARGRRVTFQKKRS